MREVSRGDPLQPLSQLWPPMCARLKYCAIEPVLCVGAGACQLGNRYAESISSLTDRCCSGVGLPGSVCSACAAMPAGADQAVAPGVALDASPDHRANGKLVVRAACHGPARSDCAGEGRGCGVAYAATYAIPEDRSVAACACTQSFHRYASMCVCSEGRLSEPAQTPSSIATAAQTCTRM